LIWVNGSLCAEAENLSEGSPAFAESPSQCKLTAELPDDARQAELGLWHCWFSFLVHPAGML
jgi:hypothetical protein